MAKRVFVMVAAQLNGRATINQRQESET